MLGKIIEIEDNYVTVQLSIDITKQPNLANLHVVFEHGEDKIVGEILNVDKTKMLIAVVGELKGTWFASGISAKPSFASTVRIIKMDELELILGSQKLETGQTYFGLSNVYKNYKINVSINDFFSNHFAILGNSGAGKSFTVSGIFQRLFSSPTASPTNANIFFFDAYGEYTRAFSNMTNINPALHYKVFTTNTEMATDEILKIPAWLLDVDDLALLLDVTTANQLPIIEKALKLVPIIASNTEGVIKYKNDIIARALEDILLSGNDSTKIRDQVTAVLTKFNTKELNLESQIAQPGYVRSLKQCLYIDKTGKMQEMELVVNFIKSFIDDSLDIESIPKGNVYYNLKHLEEAMEFALISEGILKSEKVYDFANVLSVRLHSMVKSSESQYFDYDHYVTRGEYIRELLTDVKTGGKCQIVNFNISYIDDRLAKAITKIISKLLFQMAVENKNRGSFPVHIVIEDRLAKAITKIISKLLFQTAVENPNRGSVPFHIIIEEAHRYVMKDTDIEILGYNIFDRITKEGRKYGVLLGLITQRPSELSDTAISQCSNFVILRILHPKDLDYIKNMVPNVTSEMIIQLKTLKPGNCIAFGSAFKIPTAMYMEKPDPEPLSNNVDVKNIWYKAPVTAPTAQTAQPAAQAAANFGINAPQQTVQN